MSWLAQKDAQQQMGPEGYLKALLEAGANARVATEAWLSNQCRWIMWKLAAYESSYPDQLQGKLLRADVVLDQLKYRWDPLLMYS